MTGYGAGQAEADGIRARVECSSVNRKGLEVVISGIMDWLELESLLRSIVVRTIARGRVNVSVSIEPVDSPTFARIDRRRAVEYLAELELLNRELPSPSPVPLSLVLAGPGVIRESVDRQTASLAAERALEAALAKLQEMREREGAHLVRALEREWKRISVCLNAVKRQSRGIPRRHAALLQERIRATGLKTGLSEERLAVEVALFAERCDVTEEVDRLSSHLVQFREMLASPGPVGRALEFLVQEIGREWNTIGSKANDAGLSRRVIEAKAALEKIREQIANIE